MPFFATSGSKISIGGAVEMKSTDWVTADFTSQTFTVINGVENLGTLGDEASAVTFTEVGAARDKTIKGTRNAGMIELVVAMDYADAGQVALLAAEKSTSDFAFKIELNDKPATGASPKNSTRTFIAKVMSARENYGTANQVQTMTFSLAINSNVVRTNASAS